MQTSRVLSVSPSLNCYSSNEYAEISAELIISEDFSGKLKFNVSDNQTEKPLSEESSKDHTLDEKQPQPQDKAVEDEEDYDDDDDDYEFSFFCADPDVPPISPIAAEDIFHNGQIRPIFPVFNRDLIFAGGHDVDSKSSKKASSLRPPLRKLFVEEQDRPSSSGTEEFDGVPTGTYCAWSRKAVEASPESCKKSNSTGFSKLWRFRELLSRSNSDGNDAFVFLNPTTTSAKTNQKNENVEKTEKVNKSVKVEKGEVLTERRSSAEVKVAGGKVGGKGVKGETASSAHEKHYVRNRALKEGDRRRSYLPYRQDLVGFFTNVNGLSRNVHPF